MFHVGKLHYIIGTPFVRYSITRKNKQVVELCMWVSLTELTTFLKSRLLGDRCDKRDLDRAVIKNEHFRQTTLRSSGVQWIYVPYGSVLVL